MQGLLGWVLMSGGDVGMCPTPPGTDSNPSA
eukprot:CAMPEP_0195017814 /NCGR_PEP_ID=MMETSP0326_2-20130528/28632_1 /TAXON_ID=2866 ORGANISM="Crypthecodinium cohnii, Strain Seligo" /NCGR_SAMPLE_ID=MMETSP0326_2 /ASSEMBLY_ACC=CAM_ASM_000348 /LENGTH=30 /DNA_ID= /DNA_START= /DNA_END= /DNA_ORIENTATION=